MHKDGKIICDLTGSDVRSSYEHAFTLSENESQPALRVVVMIQKVTTSVDPIDTSEAVVKSILNQIVAAS